MVPGCFVAGPGGSERTPLRALQGVSLSAQDASGQQQPEAGPEKRVRFVAADAERQPGSSFKPFVYSAALNRGYTLASLFNDAPVVFDDPSLETTWRPENYSGKFYGPTRVREALTVAEDQVRPFVELLQRRQHGRQFPERQVAGHIGEAGRAAADRLPRRQDHRRGAAARQAAQRLHRRSGGTS